MQRPALTKTPFETSRASPSHAVLLAAVIVIGLVLRTVAIGRESLWTDEALTLVLAQLPVWDMITEPTDPTPFFYYALHKAFVPEGAGVIGARGISLIAGMLTLPVVYAIGRLYFSRDGALLATALVAMSAPLIDYSQEARAYALLVLLVSASALFLSLSLQDGPAGDRRRALAGFTATSISALYTHFVAWFWIAPALLILRLCLPRSAGRAGPREALTVIAAVVLASVPEARRVVRYEAETNAFQWLHQPGPSGFLNLLAEQWLPLGISPAARWLGLALVALLAGIALVERTTIAAWARRQPHAPLIIAALCLQPLALWLFGYGVSPVLMERTILPSLVGIALLLALLVESLGHPARKIATGVLLLASAGSLALTGTVRAKEDWRGAARQLATAELPLIVVCPLWQAPALLAARANSSGVPIATLGQHGMVLLSPSGRDRVPWDRAIYQRLFRAQFASIVGEAPPPARTRRVSVSELTMVVATCSPGEIATLSDWFRPAQVDRLWQSRRADTGTVIRVERWRSASPRTLTLVDYR